MELYIERRMGVAEWRVREHNVPEWMKIYPTLKRASQLKVEGQRRLKQLRYVEYDCRNTPTPNPVWIVVRVLRMNRTVGYVRVLAIVSDLKTEGYIKPCVEIYPMGCTGLNEGIVLCLTQRDDGLWNPTVKHDRVLIAEVANRKR